MGGKGVKSSSRHSGRRYAPLKQRSLKAVLDAVVLTAFCSSQVRRATLSVNESAIRNSIL
jgi:hypothetical protein